MFKSILSRFRSLSLYGIIIAYDVNNLMPERLPNQNLPQGDLGSHFMPRAIDLMIKSSYLIAVFMFAWAGYLYINTQNDDKGAAKAKSIFIYAIIGFVIATLAYAIVQGVTRLQFFK